MSKLTQAFGGGDNLNRFLIAAAMGTMAPMALGGLGSLFGAGAGAAGSAGVAAGGASAGAGAGNGILAALAGNAAQATTPATTSALSGLLSGAGNVAKNAATNAGTGLATNVAIGALTPRPTQISGPQQQPQPIQSPMLQRSGNINQTPMDLLKEFQQRNLLNRNR